MSPAELKAVFRRILMEAAASAVAPAPVSNEDTREPMLLCAGRSPAGAIETDLSSLHGSGGYLARMAHFEAASVAAFEQLADELVALEAPAFLVEQALKAAHDERMHAEL